MQGCQELALLVVERRGGLADWGEGRIAIVANSQFRYTTAATKDCDAPMHVIYFQRRPREHANYSVERLFDGVRRELVGRVETAVCTAPCHSSGVLGRLRIIWHARRRQGDVNHVTGDVNFAALGLDGRRTILTNLDCGYIAGSRGWRRWLLRLFWLKWPVRHVAAVTTLSGAMKAEIVQHSNCPPEKVHVIPVAVPAGFAPRPRAFDSQRPRILQVGTFPNKNLLRLIEAVAGLSCTLVIIGPISDAVKRRLDELGIEFENRFQLSDEQMVREYENCDLVAFVSLYEGFGMPIIEGQALGRPVLTSDRQPMVEVAGDGACLVDPTDVRAIRAGLERIINDGAYRERLIDHGWNNVARFHPERIAGRYLELYEQIGGRVSSPAKEAA